MKAVRQLAAFLFYVYAMNRIELIYNRTSNTIYWKKATRFIVHALTVPDSKPYRRQFFVIMAKHCQKSAQKLTRT